MNPLGKTIRLFLVDGSSSGLITAEILNWTGKVLSCPRELLPNALKRPEVAKTGIYFLVGPDPEHPNRPLVYVGESDDVATRLKQHDDSEDKDFFEEVVLVVNKDENLTKSHVRYLENRLIEMIRDSGQATLKNGNKGVQATLPEADQCDMEYVLQQLRVLMPVLGYPFLKERHKRQQPIQTPISNLDESLNQLGGDFELNLLGGRIHAEAVLEDGQWVVLAGSVCRHPDYVTQSLRKERRSYIWDELKQCLNDQQLIPVPGDLELARLNEDKVFKSASRAASFVCGNSMNGHNHWKLKATGQCYGDWRRQQMESATAQPELVAL